MAWIWNNEKVKVVNLKTLPNKCEINNIEIIKTLKERQQKFIFVTHKKVDFKKMKNAKPCFNDKVNKLYYPDTGRTKNYEKRIIFQSLEMLVNKECDIIMNYNIFNFWNPKYKEILENKGYTLVLENLIKDEYNIGLTNCDIEILFNNQFIYLDKNNKIHWIEEEYKGLTFLDYKYRIQNTNVYAKDGLFFTKFEDKLLKKYFKKIHNIKNKL